MGILIYGRQLTGMLTAANNKMRWRPVPIEFTDRALQIDPDNWEDMISSHPDPTGVLTTSTDPHHAPPVHGFLGTL